MTFGRCTEGPRFTCVVDGDTVWIEGEKIRLAGIDAPEMEGKCAAERHGAALAADRLTELLSRGTIAIERDGRDRFGRTLAIVTVDGVSAGTVLIDEGFARPWDGRRRPWC